MTNGSGASDVRRPAMPWWQVAFCWTVWQLNRVPRFGRLYRVPRNAEGKLMFGREHLIKEWKWQRHGHWGLNILKRMGLLWRWLYHQEPGWADEGDDDE